MANKKNVEANKKNTEIKNKKSNKLEQKKPTQKKKRRLHSHLKVNIPLFQSLMMILPSLAKHAAAESIDNSSDAADQVTANNVTEKDVTDDHNKADSSAVALQEAQTSDNDVNSTLSASHAAHGSSSHFVPSHHLSTLSHPQVHYIPSVSMPTISSGSNGQPTHSNAPTTPALPVTFMPEVIKGTYGELHVDANGQYTFVLNPNSPQYILLNQHQPGTDHFALHLSNGSSIIVQIPVTGKQDTPNISGDLTGVVTEDHNIDSQGLLHANGKIDVIDPDQNESSVTPEVISGKYGSLTIDADGHWQYQVDNSLSNVQALTAATSLHESFTIHTKDGTPQTIDMTIGGNDDNAVITGVDAGTLTEDLTTQVQGQLSVTDSDLGEDHFQASQVTSNFGTLSITKDGAWTYNLDNNNPVVQRLGQGSTATDIVTVHSADGTAHQVMVTINGTNDHAVITSSTANSPSSFFAIGTSNGSSQVTEDKDLTVSGQLNITDIDSKEAHFSNSDLKGTLGTLHLKDNGDWTYDLDNKNPQVQALGQGSTTTDIITIHSADGTPHQIAITVNGSNDKAVISGTSAGVVTEESQLQTSGTLAVTDVDTGEAHFSNTDIVGSFGTLHLTDSGSWTYDLDNKNPAVQALGKGATATDTITVHSADGTPHQVTITVNGTNDAATVSSATVAIDETDKAVTTSGTLTSTDLDNPDNTFTPDSITGAHGDLTIDANGHWVFTANSAFNQLNVGDKVQETFTVSSIDGTPSTIKVTINGTNDAATVSSATVAIDETDKAVTTSGTLTSTDVDNPDNAFTPDSISGTNGDLTIDANGHWVFTANSAFNQLNVGDKVEETFTVSSVDGTSSTIKVTINGTNDDATISSATVAIDETDKAVTTSGTLTSTDVDNPDNAFTPDSISGTNGDLTIDANGHWAFTANSAFNQLNVGDKVEETFTVSSVDGTPSTIKVTINGTNDAATVSSATVAIDETDKAVTTSGTLTSTDVDNPDNTFTPDSISGTNGDLTIDATGHWVFIANSAFNQLNVGDKVEETFTVSSIDGTPSTIKITINGTNDKAVISGTSAGVVTEESQLQTSGSLTVTDVDAGQTHFSNTDIAGTLGTLHLTNSGTWTYDLDNTNPTVQALGKGTTATDTITVHSADGTPHQITITVNGTNDKAIISGTNSGAVTEESQLQTSGTLTVTDVDTGEAHFSNADIAGTLGTLHLTDNGTWTYDLDNTNPQVQALGKGATATDTITVNSADGTPHQITITVNGTNDTAVIGGTSAGAVTEETQLQTSGSLTITDTDTGEAHFSNTDIKGSLGTLHLTDAGQWTYDLDNTNPTVQALGKGAATTDTITVTSADGTTHQVTIAVNGTNDKAIITGTNTGAVTEDQDLTNQLNVHPNYMLTQGKLFITDVDTNEATFPMQSGIVGDHGIGSFTLIPSGIWLFSADSKQAAVQALGVGETLTESTTITSVDGTQKTILVTINGTNDAPVITPVATQTVTEDGSKTITFHATDIDTTDTLTPSVSATHGSASLNAQGEIVFTPDANYNGPATVVLSVTDGHTTTSQTINVDVTPANDAPVINPIVPVSATEDGAVVTGQLTSTDIDAGDTATFTTTSTQGGFTLNADGSYNLDPTDASFQHLKAGEISTFTIPVTVTDSAGATDTKDLVITVTGTNDTPVISGVDTGALKEDVSANPQSNELTATGKLDIVDIDTGEGSFVSHGFNKTALQGHYGKLEISQDGSWSYSADNSQTAIQSLGEGEQLTDTIKVTSRDGTTHDVVVTINGTNDTAVIGGTSAGAVTEETQLQTSGTLTVTDTDTGEAHFANTDIQGTLGTLHLTDNGAWTYDLDNTNPAVQALGNGATATDTITVHSADGTPHQVTITVNGTNDNAVVGGVDTASVTEKAAGDNMSPDHAQSGMATLRVSTLNANGHLSVIDPDSGQSGFADNNVGYNYHGTYGDLILNPNGDWNYYADAGSLTHIGGRPTTRGSAIDKLGEGETLTDTITVHTKDGTPHNIVITINGSNDRPYCSSEVQLNAGTEDTRQTITAAQLLQNSIDVDKNDSGLLTVANLHPDHGSILDNQNGTYTFTPEKDYNGKVHFTYDVKDAHGGVTHTDATTTLSEVGDAAIITSGAQQTIIEDASGRQNEIANGMLSITDPDAGEQQFRYSQFGEQAIHDPFGGHLNISVAGVWAYSVPDSALQHLGAGQTEKVSYLVHSYDGTAHTINIDVVGTNDKPTVNAHVITSTEDQAHTFNASEFGFADVDDGATLDHITIATVPTALEGSLTLNGKLVHNGDIVAASEIGNLSFIPAKDFTGVINFGYSVNDGTANSSLAIMKLDITNINDAAHFQGDKLGSVTEDLNVHSGNLLTQGTLQSTDVDNPDNRFSAENIHQLADGSTAQGQLMIGADGRWVYRIDNASVQHLGSGATLTETFTVHSIDGTEQAIAVTVVGTNDAPTLSVQLSGNSAGQLHGSDIDTGDQMQYDTLQPHGQFGQLQVDSTTGAFSYQQAASVAGMNFDSTTGTYSAKEVFEVRVSDGHGGESHQFVSFDVTATVSSPATTGGIPTITTQIANVPVVTATQPQQISTTPPVNNVNLTLATSSDSGTSSTDHITNDNTPMVTGTTDIPFSQVTIYEGSTPVGHAISDANGDYSTDLTTLTDGLHNLSAKALAPSSVLPAVSGVLSVNVDTDTVAPSVDLAATSDSGISNHDDLTNQHTPVITGIAEANAAISITDEHGNVVASGTTNASGLYQLTTSNLAEGDHTLTVEATDTAGNQQSAALALQVDYTAPTISNVYLSTSTTHQTTFAGSVDIDTTQVDIVIKHGNQIVETLHATLDGKGGYSVDATNLPDQTYTAYIQATDKAGNQTPSKFDRFSVDTHADAPSISFESTGSDNQYNAAEVALGAAATITAMINIPADADKSDTLFINGQAHVLTGAEILAKQVLVEITPGAQISASITDANGNASTLAQAIAPTADLSAAPLTIVLAHDTGVANDLITNDALLTITGQETGASIEYSIDNGKTWASSFTPQQGSNTVSVRQTDLAGNVSPESALTFTLDSQIAAPTISLKNDTSAHVSSNSDHITQDGQLNIATEAGAKLEYSIDGGQHWLTQFSPNEGQNNLQVRQTDTAGNVSGASHFSFTLDTTPGTVSVDPIAKDNALNAAENNQPLVITGSTSNIAAGDQVYVKFDSQHVYLGTVKADGTWSLSLSASDHQSLMSADKDYAIKIGSVDVAGNVTPEISTHLLVDTHNPIPVISVDSVTNDNVINKLESSSNIDITGRVSGDFSVGDAISLTINGQLVTGYTGQVNAQGHYSISVPAHVLLTQNIHSNSLQGHTIEASVITLDSVGNVGSATSGVRPFSYDTHCKPPQLSLTHDTGDGQDHITSDGALTIQNQEAGAIIEYSVDGGNTWSHQFSPVSGSNTVLARQTDTAGNTSGNSSLTFTLDNSVNAPQVSLKTDSGDSAIDQLTNHGELSVTGLEKGAVVEYSTDNGGHWQQSFTPVEGLNNVQVRQTDIAGNVSAATTVSYTLDTHTDIRVNSADIDNNGEMYVQVYLPKDAEVTQIEITSDGGGTPVLVNVNVPHKGGPSSSHPDHQYLQFDHIDLSTLAEGQLNIHVTGTDHAGNTATAQSLNSYGHPLILDRTASASDDSNTTLEDSVQPVTGNVLSNDSDAIALTTIGDVQGTYGLFHLNANGSYTYTLDNNLAAVQQLGAGSTPLVDSVVYSAVDNHGNTTTADLAIAIQGTNDAPQMSSVVTLASGTEDTDVTIQATDLLANATDVDHNDAGQLTLGAINADHGTVTDNLDGTYTLHPEAGYNGQVSLTYDITDAHSGSVTTSASMTLAAVTPQLTIALANDTGSSNSDHVTQDGTLAIGGQEAGSTVEYSIDAGQNWTNSFAPQEGSNMVTVRQTDSHGNSSIPSTLFFTLDTHAGNPTVSFESSGADHLYSQSEIGADGTITGTIDLPTTAKIGDTLHINGVDHVISQTDLTAGKVDHEVHPGDPLMVILTDTAGNSSHFLALSADGEMQTSVPSSPIGTGTGTVPMSPVVQAQHVSGSNGVTIHSTDTHGGFALTQYGGADIRSPYGTAHIDPQSGHVGFQPIGTGNPHTAHQGHFEIFQHGQHVADVDVTSYNHNHQPSQIQVTPVVAPPPPPPVPVQHDEPDFSHDTNADLSFTVDDHSIVVSDSLHQQASEHVHQPTGAAAYLDALGIKPDATSTTVHDQPADMDIVLAQVDQPDAATHDQAHLDISDALEHHDANINHNQDDEHHHHNDIDGLPDIDPNS
ncbi:VCBS domain-containing protein [Vibrio splendidus]